MKIKVFFIIVIMSFFNFTTLYASSDYSTNVTFTIPASYTVLLDIGKHGKVIINNEVYDYRHKSVEVKRMTEQKYIIQPDSGWQIKDVVYTKNGNVKSMQCHDNVYTAAPIQDNGYQLHVRFKEKYERINSVVFTGDSISLLIWGFLLILFVFIFQKIKKHNKQ